MFLLLYWLSLRLGCSEAIVDDDHGSDSRMFSLQEHMVGSTPLYAQRNTRTVSANMYNWIFEGERHFRRVETNIYNFLAENL